MIRGLAFRGALLTGFTTALAATLGFLAASGTRPASAWLLLMAALLPIGLIAGYLAFWRTSVALRAISHAAERIGQGEFRQYVATTTGSTADVASSFNHMASRIVELFQETLAEHARLEAVFDASTDPMIALAADTSVRFLNPAAEILLDSSQEEAIGRPFIETARDYELDAVVRRVINQKSRGETRVVTFGPQRALLRALAVPIHGGGDWAVLLVLNDLTEVQRVDQMRRDFLSNVSHELRTPLASIRALVETLEDGGVDGPDDEAEFLRRIRQQVDRLTSLVNELLDLSRIESGAIELHPEPVDLAELVIEAASLLRTRCEADSIHIQAPEPAGITVEADRPSLLRVMSNLLDNAIKYSPPAGVIRVDVRDEGELVAVAVMDEGPGIRAQDLPRVFERFYKGDPSRAGAGVGLGLAIVKHVVRAHGGTVEAASLPGDGATFIVRLPHAFVGAGAVHRQV